MPTVSGEIVTSENNFIIFVAILKYKKLWIEIDLKANIIASLFVDEAIEEERDADPDACHNEDRPKTIWSEKRGFNIYAWRPLLNGDRPCTTNAVSVK